MKPGLLNSVLKKSVCVCVFVCVRMREGQRQRETERWVRYGVEGVETWDALNESESRSWVSRHHF